MALKSKAMKEILPYVDVTIRNYDGNTVLHTIFDSISWKGLVTLLLPYSDVYAKNNAGETPLLLAASYTSAFHSNRDYVNDMKLLILHSPVNVTDVEGRTALHRCADKGHLDAIKLLFPHSSANKLDKTGKSALHYALEGDEVDIVKLLLLNSSVAATDRMILRFSAQCDYINIARFLLRLASSSARDASARMPLNRCSPESGFDIVRLLPHLSASTVDEQGSTLLRISAKHGHVEVVQMILPHSDANIPDGNGDSALHVVACKRSLKRSKQDLAVVRLLLPYSKDYTQFHRLKYRDPVQKLLHLHSPVVS
ncbi:serine/threonine-protein phosphatase 6 regulatory ankyrin repeat subunit A-like [Ornithodoros turicata]|uniref:serine/threonine-protein phosphatase 6 regulatory ankyrin repeat subunit A-like n=1 Tax=Ornithodoros turicata TaxID=34597 RepID=UPI003139BE69